MRFLYLFPAGFLSILPSHQAGRFLVIIITMRREELCKLLAEVEKRGVNPATALVEVRKEKDQTIIDIYQDDIWLEAEIELEEGNIEELIEQLSEQFEEVREAKEPIHILPIK